MKNEIKEEINKQFEELVQHINPLDYLSQFIAPEIAGHSDVKKALLLMLVSDEENEPFNARRRIHIGMIGKAGTGKSVFMKALERDFGAVYLNFGVQILKQAHRGILCIDEIKLMEQMDREALCDVMESGMVILRKGCEEERYDAKVRFVVGSNSFKNMSDALIDRLDFVFTFEKPSPEEAKEIARNEIAKLREYLQWIGNFSPSILEEDEIKINELFDQYFDITQKGMTGRWRAKVMRIAFAHAKLRKDDVRVEDVKIALKMLNNRNDDENAVDAFMGCNDA